MDTTPELLGERYRLEERIDEGGAGEVFRAFDTRLQRRVAVKLLRPTGATSATRATHEARALAGFEHPNLVRALDVGEHGGRGYLVLELVAGRTLARRVREDGALPLAEAVRVVGGASAGLAALHAAGRVHGDVSASNVLAPEEDAARLIDLGLSRSAGDPGQDRLEGTLPYLAPERLRGGQPDPAADVYALGVVAYLATTGELPFQGDGPSAVIAAHAAGAVPPSVRLPGLPPALDAVFERVFSEPGLRPTAAGLGGMIASAAAAPALGVSRQVRVRATGLGEGLGGGVGVDATAATRLMTNWVGPVPSAVIHRRRPGRRSLVSAVVLTGAAMGAGWLLSAAGPTAPVVAEPRQAAGTASARPVARVTTTPRPTLRRPRPTDPPATRIEPERPITRVPSWGSIPRALRAREAARERAEERREASQRRAEEVREAAVRRAAERREADEERRESATERAEERREAAEERAEERREAAGDRAEERREAAEERAEERREAAEERRDD